jgi:hypothetical protein
MAISFKLGTEGFMNVKKQYWLNEAGVVSGSAFPEGTYLRFEGTPESRKCYFVFPDKTTEELTHDMVKCATILCNGVFMCGSPMGNPPPESINGVKYPVVLKDGRQFVHLVHLAETHSASRRVRFVLLMICLRFYIFWVPFYSAWKSAK